MSDSATPWTAASQAFLSITNSKRSLKLMSIELVMPFNHLILCHPLLLPSIFPSIRVISNESAVRIRWPKYWNFSFNISPSNEHSELISFRMDCLDLLAVQGTLKSLLWEGGGGRVQVGNTCIPVVDSFWYMAKPIQYCKVKKKRFTEANKWIKEH